MNWSISNGFDGELPCSVPTTLIKEVSWQVWISPHLLHPSELSS